jgi:2-iminoacetate synthase
MTFYDKQQQYSTLDFAKYTSNVSDEMIKCSIQKKELTDFDFLNLLSPKALNYIEEIAQKAHKISIEHFGKCILLYAPLYVSNFCINNCVYCGFSTGNKIKREVLSFKEIEENCNVIAGYGINHVLLVTGESTVKTPLDYLKKCVKILKKYFEGIDIEIYPLNEHEYKELADAGADGLTIYQETYNENLYKVLHTIGNKTDYRNRLETCERAGTANFRNLNVGALLGLNDFISEIFFASIHAKYLQKKFPSAEIGISFPRLRPAAGSYQPKIAISDNNLVQAICAVRLFINRINITISTRENKNLRDNLIPLGITKMSAASKTQVGGYAKKTHLNEQFEINDAATVEEVKVMIYRNHYQPIMKDWINL